MSITKIGAVINSIRHNVLSSTIISTRQYAKPLGGGGLMGPKKKKLGKLGPIMEKKILPVESDVNKLVSSVCGSNILKTGEDIKLKSNSEYPDWLWTLNVDRIIPLQELDPNTKQYWRRVRKMTMRRNNQLSKLKKF